MDDSDKRNRIVARLRPANWDNVPAIVADELREMIKGIVDEGTNVDSGCGNGYGHLWFTIDGVELYLTVIRSAKQVEIDSRKSST